MIGGKHQSRQIAMQVLFFWDAQDQQDTISAQRLIEEASPDALIRRRAMDMAQGAWEIRAQSDEWILRLAPKWPTKRQPGVDRSLLRLAVWELTRSDTPPKVVIDEAIELAKQFSTEQSPAFINGLLDAVRKEHETGKPAPAEEIGVNPSGEPIEEPPPQPSPGVPGEGDITPA